MIEQKERWVIKIEMIKKRKKERPKSASHQPTFNTGGDGDEEDDHDDEDGELVIIAIKEKKEEEET